MPVSKEEREILRGLGRELMEAAHLPVQEEKKKLWKALNRGEMIRPMVVLDQFPWHELNVNSELDLHVTDPYWRGVENELRRTLYKWRHFPVDMVIDPFIRIPRIQSNTGYGLEIHDAVVQTDTKNDVMSHHYECQVKDWDDIEKFTDLHITLHEEATAAVYTEAQEIFDGIGPTQWIGWQFFLGPWDILTHYMGVEQIYIDLMDRPDFMKALVWRVTESIASGINDCNKLKIHDDNTNVCHCSYTYTDELLPDSGMGKGSTSENSWAFGLAQLFSSVSPEIFEEFELPSITELARHFGMIYYGCCDRLDNKLDLVKRIPNVKKVSCSPWADRDAFAEKLDKSLIMSNKPNPAYVGGDDMNYGTVRDDLLWTCKAAKRGGVGLEFILKDISTVNYQPERLTKWAETAMRVVENY